MRIDFYVLPYTSPNAIEEFFSRLIEKIYLKNLRLDLVTNNNEASERWDRVLWTYRDISFLPHEQAGSLAPIQIFTTENLQKKADILLNLTDSCPALFMEYPRIIDRSTEEPGAKAHARERYRQYRDAGATITTHPLQASASSNTR